MGRIGISWRPGGRSINISSSDDMVGTRATWMALTAAALLAARLEALIAGVTAQQVVNLMNSARASVVPSATKMVQLQWNETLAVAAARYAATQCSGVFTDPGPNCTNCLDWIADAETPSFGTHGILDIITRNFVAEKAKWSCTQSAGSLTCTCISRPCYGDWTTLVNDAATEVGCGEQTSTACKGPYNVYVCAFNGHTTDAHPYTPSTTNSSCTQSTCPSAYPFCANGLCTKQPTTQSATTRTVLRPTSKGRTNRPRTTEPLIGFATRRPTSRHKPMATTERRSITRSWKKISQTRALPVSRTTNQHSLNEKASGTRKPSSSGRPGMVTTVHKASWTKTQTRILHQPRATARLTLDLNAPKTSFKGAPADQGRATAQQTSAFEGISHTVLFITGAVVVVCLATIAICILKPTKQVELVWRNEPMPAAPPPPFVTITAPVAPAAVVLPAQRQPSAVGHPVAESHRSSMVPKSIRRMQARGMARDKFNQRAMTLTTSETDTWQSSVTEP